MMYNKTNNNKATLLCQVARVAPTVTKQKKRLFIYFKASSYDMRSNKTKNILYLSQLQELYLHMYISYVQ